MTNKDGRFVLSGTGSSSIHTNQQLCGRLSSVIHDEIRSQLLVYPELMILAGGARGFDFLLAQAAMVLGIDYVLALPNQGYKNYYWPDITPAEQEVFDHASKTIYVCKSLYVDGLHSNFVRNNFMVEHSDFMLVYNPVSPGTKHCFGTIKKVGRLHKVII